MAARGAGGEEVSLGAPGAALGDRRPRGAACCPAPCCGALGGAGPPWACPAGAEPSGCGQEEHLPAVPRVGYGVWPYCTARGFGARGSEPMQQALP